MRVFLSHKKEDSSAAVMIAAQLQRSDIPYYLDVLDEELVQDPVRLTAHLKRQVEESSHLMAIISQRTQGSWWVPFEIGLAVECSNPICSYVLESVQLPDYLKSWPYLRNSSDLQLYVSEARSQLLLEQYVRKDAVTKRRDAVEFERHLKLRLGQP